MLKVKVWGQRACFTRPENKVERVSYDVMTPSAARGLLEAIFWKPEFYYIIHQIDVINPIKKESMLRNEVNRVASPSTVKKWAEQGGFYDVEEDRAQRHNVYLKDVCYVIHLEIALQPHATSKLPKYRDMFRKRVQRGQCFETPYFGIREFVANFGPAEDTETPIPLTTDLGNMLLDVQFIPSADGPIQHWHHDGSQPTLRKAKAVPEFFHAKLEEGVLRVPLLKNRGFYAT